MPTYVDDMKTPYRRMLMSHLFCDPVRAVNELHELAARIGLQRRWFQDKPGFPHYDLCQSYRAKAIEAGAIPIDTRTLIEMVQARR